MQILKLSKCCLIALMCVGLFACATASHNKADKMDKAGSVNSYDEESIHTSGIGNETNFGSGKENALKPGFNQIYYFDFDSSVVHDSDRLSLEVQAKYLSCHPSAKARLEGHTDNQGSREYNIALGERRARSVADVLKMNGVAANQIKVVSFGAQKPVAFGNTEEDYQLNRRVELIYEKK